MNQAAYYTLSYKNNRDLFRNYVRFTLTISYYYYERISARSDYSRDMYDAYYARA